MCIVGTLQDWRLATKIRQRVPSSNLITGRQGMFQHRQESIYGIVTNLK